MLSSKIILTAAAALGLSASPAKAAMSVVEYSGTYVPGVGDRFYSGGVSGSWFRASFHFDRPVTGVLFGNETIAYRRYGFFGEFIDSDRLTFGIDTRFSNEASVTWYSSAFFGTYHNPAGVLTYADGFVSGPALYLADLDAPVGYRMTVAYGVGTPEPGTWTMMILGFSLIGRALRKRRRMVAPRAETGRRASA